MKIFLKKKYRREDKGCQYISLSTLYRLVHQTLHLTQLVPTELVGDLINEPLTMVSFMNSLLSTSLPTYFLFLTLPENTWRALTMGPNIRLYQQVSRFNSTNILWKIRGFNSTNRFLMFSTNREWFLPTKGFWVLLHQRILDENYQWFLISTLLIYFSDSAYQCKHESFLPMCLEQVNFAPYQQVSSFFCQHNLVDPNKWNEFKSNKIKTITLFYN